MTTWLLFWFKTVSAWQMAKRWKAVCCLDGIWKDADIYIKTIMPGSICRCWECFADVMMVVHTKVLFRSTTDWLWLVGKMSFMHFLCECSTLLHAFWLHGADSLKENVLNVFRNTTRKKVHELKRGENHDNEKATLSPLICLLVGPACL